MSDLSAVALDALRAATLDATLARLDLRIPELQALHGQAEETAGAEVADVRSVSSGPYAWWLRLTGAADEVVAKEEAEAREAVQALRGVRDELYAVVRERDAAREARTALGDAPERLERALFGRAEGADVARVEARYARAGEAVGLVEELLAELRRASALAGGVGRGGDPFAPRDASRVGVAEVDLLAVRVATIRAALDRIDAALEGAGSDAVIQRWTKHLDVSGLEGPVHSDGAVRGILFRVTTELQNQEIATRRVLPIALHRRADLAAEREAAYRALADVIVGEEL